MTSSKPQNDASTPLVIVKWVDSRQAAPAWAWLREIGQKEHDPVACVSVGWLVRNDMAVKVIAQSLGDVEGDGDVQAAGVMVIPTCCVTSIERLIEDDEPVAILEAAE